MTDYIILEKYPIYKIYKNGDVIGKFKMLKPYIRSKTSPYLCLTLFDKNKISHKIFLHKLLAECFIPNILPTAKYIDHIDGNKLNNNLNNLRWCTTRQNMFNVKKKHNGASIQSEYKFISWHIRANKFVGNIQVGKKRSFYCTGTNQEELYIKCLKKLCLIRSAVELSFYDTKVQQDLIKYNIL